MSKSKRNESRASGSEIVATMRMSAAEYLANILEGDLQQSVSAFAKLHGWQLYHTHDSMHSAAGFPDLVLARPPELIFAELKRETEKPTAAQVNWLESLEAAGQEVHVWRPSDWQDGSIEARLR